MRKLLSDLVERARLRSGELASDSSYGCNGAFELTGPHGRALMVIASDNLGWEHVSVSLPTRTPNWAEMCFVKNLFWDEEETVVQFHPARSEYVNCHPNCLHLWRPIGRQPKLPPAHLVGPK
jgi:hypothetical protein